MWEPSTFCSSLDGGWGDRHLPVPSLRNVGVPNPENVFRRTRLWFRENFRHVDFGATSFLRLEHWLFRVLELLQASG